MSYDEFWYGSIERLGAYWQANQLNIERKNQELWLQGVYIRAAIASCLDSKGKAKYPEKPQRITEMTDAEREEENKRKVDNLKSILNEHKRRWDMRKKQGVDALGC